MTILRKVRTIFQPDHIQDVTEEAYQELLALGHLHSEEPATPTATAAPEAPKGATTDGK